MGAKTPSVRVVVSVRLPEVPVMVSVVIPTGAEELAVKVKPLLAEVGFGFQDAVTPAGNPETESVTFPENPYSAFT